MSNATKVFWPGSKVEPDGDQDTPQLPGLSPAELERLAVLAEELSEAGVEIGKILRHGYESYHPDRPADGTNRDRLARELGDIGAAITLMIASGDMRAGAIETAVRSKLAKLPRWLHHHSQSDVPCA